MKCTVKEFLDLSREIFVQGGVLRFCAHGGSMRPFIKDGDILKIASVTADKIALGDVILYHKDEESIIVHRVVKKILEENKPSFLVKGDMNPPYGEIVSVQNILGKVVGIERNKRKFNFDRGIGRLQNKIYARISLFFSRRIYPFLVKIKRIFSRVKD